MMRALARGGVFWWVLFGMALPETRAGSPGFLDPGWTQMAPLVEAVARRSDSLPLSDQQDEARWVMVPSLSDEFSGDRVDPKIWETAKPTWEGRPPITFDPRNISMGDGTLVLRVSGALTGQAAVGLSAGFTHAASFLRSKAKLRYGYVEIRAKLARSTVTSAFFLMDTTPESSTEIDVFEVAAGDAKWGNRIGMSLHAVKTPGNEGTERDHRRSTAYWRAPAGLSDDFHVYGLMWNEHAIVWYFDGVTVRRVRNQLHHYPLTVRLDLEAQAYCRANPREDLLPADFVVVYVRTWQRAPPEKP